MDGAAAAAVVNKFLPAVMEDKLLLTDTLKFLVQSRVDGPTATVMVDNLPDLVTAALLMALAVWVTEAIPSHVQLPKSLKP